LSKEPIKKIIDDYHKRVTRYYQSLIDGTRMVDETVIDILSPEERIKRIEQHLKSRVT
jgi:tRNA A58 N-methylase Trm61